jgi:hypothetical protein
MFRKMFFGSIKMVFGSTEPLLSLRHQIRKRLQLLANTNAAVAREWIGGSEAGGL